MIVAYENFFQESKHHAMRYHISLSKVEDFVKDFEERNGSRIIKLIRNTTCQHLCLVNEILNPFKVVVSINFIGCRLIPSNHKAWSTTERVLGKKYLMMVCKLHLLWIVCILGMCKRRQSK